MLFVSISSELWLPCCLNHINLSVNFFLKSKDHQPALMVLFIMLSVSYFKPNL